MCKNITESKDRLALTPSFFKDLAMPLERLPSASMTITLELSYRSEKTGFWDIIPHVKSSHIRWVYKQKFHIVNKDHHFLLWTLACLAGNNIYKHFKIPFKNHGKIWCWETAKSPCLTGKMFITLVFGHC